MVGTPIYLDHHATTPVDDRVLSAMLPYFRERFGNASSRGHAFGRIARDAIDQSRTEVAGLLHCNPEEIVFTSGATESDNLAILGVAHGLREKGTHIVTVRTEHKAVLDTCAALERGGWRISYLDVDDQGLVSVDTVAAALTQETVLISVMLANNEIGVVQPVAEIASLAEDRGVLLHCDAAQGLGYLPLSMRDVPIDLVSISGHKIYAPKGAGALYVRSSVAQRGILAPQIHGGGHEKGLRSGTLNVPGIVGFGAAAAIMTAEGAVEAVRLARLRDSLRERLLREIPETRLNGAVTPRHPGNLNVSFRHVDGAALLLELAEHIAVSSGAACSSAAPGPSYVLEALGVPVDEAAASVRFGLGRATTAGEIDRAGDAVIEVVSRLRSRSPLWQRRIEGKPIDW